MSPTHFDEIAGWEVKEYFPEFYDRRGRFFEIIYKSQEIGFVGVQPIFSEECELEVFVFPEYRHTITKGIVFAVLDFPRSLFFKRCMMTTTRPTLLKLFQTLLKKGILKTELRDQKQIFIRTYE